MADQTDQSQQQLQDDPQIVEFGGESFVAKLFHYVLNFALPGTGNPESISQSLQIDSDSDFQLIMLMGSRTSPLATVEVYESSAGGLAWQSNPVNIDNFLGTAQLPFPAGLIPQLMPKKRAYNVKVTSTSGAANTVQIDFWGYKLYPAAQAAQLGATPSTS